MLATSGGITTVLGLVGAVQYRKQHKRLKESEAKLAEVNVDKGRNEAKDQETNRLLAQIDHQQKPIDKYIERYDTLVTKSAEREDQYQADLKDWSERYTEQTHIVRDQRKEITELHEREKEHIRREVQLEKERDHYKSWRCYREYNRTDEGCERRKPKQPIPLKYVPLEGECEECNECMNEHGAD